ncbi:hypothetical protein MRX96_051822 [Rhipicephalus microplus]
MFWSGELTSADDEVAKIDPGRDTDALGKAGRKRHTTTVSPYKNCKQPCCRFIRYTEEKRVGGYWDCWDTLAADGTVCDSTRVLFFTFPKDPIPKKRWLVAIKRHEGKFLAVTKHKKVCSTYFVNNNYVLNVVGDQHCLRVDAIPSVFAFEKPQRLAWRNLRDQTPVRLASATAVRHQSGLQL